MALPQLPPQLPPKSGLASPSSSVVQPFPLPPYVTQLPTPELVRFAADRAAVEGYVASHPLFLAFAQEQQAAVADQLQELAQLVLRAQALQERYSALNTEALPQYRRLQQQWEEAEVRMLETLEQFTPGHLKARLQDAARQADAESQAIRSQAGGDVLANIKQYRLARRLYHMRREQAARWDEERVMGGR